MLTWDEVLILAKEKYGMVEYIESDMGDYNFSACCDYTKGSIVFNTKAEMSFKTKVQLLFHELGHIHCYKNGIWRSYHFNRDKPLTEDQKRLVIRTGLKAERWIDKWASERMMEHLGYAGESGYASKKAALLYRKHHLSNFRTRKM